MGLENLKSIFQDELNKKIEDFSSNTSTNVNNTNFFNEPPQPTIHIATNPTDFSSAVGNNELPFTPLNQLGNSFLDGLSWETLYNPNHSPKNNPEHKGLTPISYPNVSRDKLNIRNPEDGLFGFGGSFRTSVISGVGKLIKGLGIGGSAAKFLQDTGKEPYIVSSIPESGTDLFSGRTINFGSMDFPIERSVVDAIRLAKYLTSPSGALFITKQNILGLQGQKYKSGYNPVSSVATAAIRAGGGPVTLFDRTQPSIWHSLVQKFLGEDEYPNFAPGAEPGIEKDQTELLKKAAKGDLGGLESLGKGSPLGVKNVLDDLMEDPLKKFTFSNFINHRYGPFRPGQEGFKEDLEKKAEKAKQEFMRKNPKFAKKNKDNKKDISEVDEQVAEKYPHFNASGDNESPMGVRGEDIESDFDFADFKRIEGNYGPFSENDTKYPLSHLKELNETFRPKDLNHEQDNSGIGGDVHTLMQFGRRDQEKSNELDRLQYREQLEDAHPIDTNNDIINGSQHGMPFYFKDMRDGAFIFFRAYLEGLTENISPTWTSSNYMGRSEPVYVYERSERDISFTIKLFAQTKKELAAIYEKLNRLTSLAYPEYYRDSGADYGNRMKAPITKLRIGELYGTGNNELMGFLKSVSYSMEQTSPWETEAGKRVPKFIMANITYQVIHAKVPNLETQFYGYIGDDQMADPQGISERLRSGEDV